VPGCRTVIVRSTFSARLVRRIFCPFFGSFLDLRASRFKFLRVTTLTTFSVLASANTFVPLVGNSLQGTCPSEYARSTPRSSDEEKYGGAVFRQLVFTRPVLRNALVESLLRGILSFDKSSPKCWLPFLPLFWKPSKTTLTFRLRVRNG
jgi:hypothetical protein